MESLNSTVKINKSISNNKSKHHKTTTTETEKKSILLIHYDNFLRV